MMNNPLMLFRNSREVEYELPYTEKYFNVFQNRCSIGVGGTVVCRYSALPFYKELEDDLSYLGCKLINSYEQHRYIANFDYYNDIKDLTPETWFNTRDVVRSGYQGPFVLKGRTNSRKYNWNTHMYAPTLSDLWRIDTELRNDGLIGYQDIIYRKYIPLLAFENGINGIRYSNEWRYFIYKDRILSSGYYWSTGSDETIETARSRRGRWDVSEKQSKLITEVIDRLKDKANFYVVDIAETESGDWIVIEINDGQMSGLSENDPDEMYRNLAFAMKEYLS